jgi:SHOCT-like domain
MNEDRKRVLAMLADGKITAEEAERLLDAMGRPVAASVLEAPRSSNGSPKYFRVEVYADEPGDGPTKVNVRIPMQLLRAGVRLSALIPPRAREEVNRAMAREGIPFDINQIKPENLEELIEHLSDFSVDVDNEKAKVRVYCE